MRRPHFEAAPFLAAHGFPEAAAEAADPSPSKRWRPRMSEDVRFALLPANPHAKPVIFPDVDALARHIQRARGLQGLELVDVQDLEISGDTVDRPGVTVHTLDAGNDRDRLIGHAYLAGRGQDVLRAALQRNRLVIVDDEAEAA